MTGGQANFMEEILGGIWIVSLSLLFYFAVVMFL